MIQTMPNQCPDVSMEIQHHLTLPQCCPVSGNPYPGSRIILAYQAGMRVLEVISLKAYIDSSARGRGSIRTMEGTLQTIAQDCAGALGIPVRLRADLTLWPDQRLFVHIVATP